MRYLNSHSMLPWLKDTLKPYGMTSWGCMSFPSSFKEELGLPLEGLKNIVLGREEWVYLHGDGEPLVQRNRSFAAVKDGLVQLLGSLFLVVRIPVRLMVTIGTKVSMFFSSVFSKKPGSYSESFGEVHGASYGEQPALMGGAVLRPRATSLGGVDRCVYAAGSSYIPEGMYAQGGGCSAAEELVAREQRWYAPGSAAGSRAVKGHLIDDISDQNQI